MAEEKKYSGYGYHGGGRKAKGSEPKTCTMSFVCTAGEKQMIKELSKENGGSISSFIMAAVYSYKMSLHN